MLGACTGRCNRAEDRRGRLTHQVKQLVKLLRIDTWGEHGLLMKRHQHDQVFRAATQGLHTPQQPLAHPSFGPQLLLSARRSRLPPASWWVASISIRGHHGDGGRARRP